MVRMKNKGFSLIEVVVAVAILTLLMAPILVQVTQTLSTSAAAKERQHAVENAEYVLNYIQETPVSKLQMLPDKLAGSASTSLDADGKVVFTGCVTAPKSCYVHVCGTYDGLDNFFARGEVDAAHVTNAISGMPVSVAYTTNVYNLEDAKLGRQKNTYQRKVVLDNLRAMLAAENLTVETGFNAEAVETLKNSGYQITTEGTAVKYAADGSVSDIICAEVSGINSPNGSGTSYMQDLDSTKVAIIQGAASNFDAQAENDLYNLKMNLLKAKNPDAWVQAMNSRTGKTILNTELFNDNVSKLTRITIVSGYDKDRKLKYYDVDCTVFYEDYLTKNPNYSGGSSSEASKPLEDLDADLNVPDVLTYNAYSRRFYTNQAPDVYLIYEPYVTYDSDGAKYSKNDYILTYDGVNYGPNEKHSKLYMIKPNKGRLNTTGEEETRSFKTTLNSDSEDYVHIYVDQLKRKTGGNQAMQIFTNIDLNNFKINNSIAVGSKTGVQYGPNLNRYYDVPKSVNDDHVSKDDKYTYDADITRENYPAKLTIGGKPVNSIRDINEDVTLTDRVYTVSVQLDRLKDDGTGSVQSGYSVKLTGAKGAE